LPPLEYPDRFEVRYVSANGGIRWNSRWVNVSTVCVGEYVGLEEIDDGLWTVYFGPVRLGRLSERHLYFQPPAGLRIVGGRGTAGSRWSGLEE
jgi:putative transposase